MHGFFWFIRFHEVVVFLQYGPVRYETDSQLANFDQFRHSLLQEIEEIVESRTTHLHQIINTLQSSLAALPDPETVRAKQLSDRMIDSRIKMKLRDEALDAWDKLPQSERFTKTGLFSKAEDTTKKDRFVNQYVSERYDDRFKKEFGITD